MSRPKKFCSDTGVPMTSKRDCVLGAARQVFLESGYAAASMDAVAAQANVSKATIYAHFENKRGLFEAVIGGRCELFFADIGVPDSYTDGRQALSKLGHAFLELILSQEALAIHRVVVAEAPRLPEVGEAFYEAGPRKGLARVAHFLVELTQRGLLAVPEAEASLVADLFLSMLRSNVHYRALLGLPEEESDHNRLIDTIVDLLIARFGVKAE